MGRILFILLIWWLVLSCDVAKEDSVGTIMNGGENTTSTFYTLKESNLSIDPTSFEKLKSANALIVSQVPKNGEAKFLENGFVFYRRTNQNALNDSFTISGKELSGTTVNEEIKVNFVASLNDLPCNAGLLGDKIEAEIGKAKEINVLENDKTCGDFNSNSLSIEIRPKNGKVEIINQKIVYTSNQDFMGDDIFFYRVGINNKKNPMAPVEVSVLESEECVKGMTDDVINILSYTTDTDLLLNVLDNDRICTNYKNAELKIIKNLSVGTLRIEKNNNKWLIYFRSSTPPKGIQTFEYGLFRSEKIYIKATVSINFN
ncbi:hypothetical protein Emtol_0485 [Emticicia oligotrophica DSM 17448]|uniref:Lipoprotein n=1 Tax=Emticicia oligotrophica (strain DSM 17448 / CIP 109782 / MTCC 6937 / GPTSA100-15) TaxID=929562 RepID=A0ABM5MWZ9_EMTOG|nr:Ig-like domain-containing protein [Emticicia oligotrophica]AFK01639.1 hypothetical protein Emtol_0485 [Emticicia oligotrophica DSM 17448]